MGEEVFWKVWLSREDLNDYLDWRGNGFLIGEKRKYQGRIGETNFLSIKRIARFVRIAAAHRERFL